MITVQVKLLLGSYKFKAPSLSVMHVVIYVCSSFNRCERSRYDYYMQCRRLCSLLQLHAASIDVVCTIVCNQSTSLYLLCYLQSLLDSARQRHDQRRDLLMTVVPLWQRCRHLADTLTQLSKRPAPQDEQTLQVNTSVAVSVTHCGV